MNELIRNIAIIAHVDHGKTTLVDCLLRQSDTVDRQRAGNIRSLDSGDLEQERGITITAKNVALRWKGHKINIIDTPGHSDFGGEVERILSMVDSVLLLVDAMDGPMPQTRFVTRKAFAYGYRPIVAINKVDRPGARPGWVLDQTFELFDRLGATDAQLDFPVIYTSATLGYARSTPDGSEEDMSLLFDTILKAVPPPKQNPDGPFQMQITALGYSSYVGAIGIGRINRGSVQPGQNLTVVSVDGKQRNGRVLQVLGFHGAERMELERAEAGDIVALTGIDGLLISDTLCAREKVEVLPALSLDMPTIAMNFEVNKSPFSGRSGKFLTSRQIGDRLRRELITNIALRVEPTADPDVFKVSGRGELHLSILIESMRREGYEVAVSRPQVILREIDGETCEPWESLLVDIEEQHQGAVMELIAIRGGELLDMGPPALGRVRLDYRITSRGLIGFRTEFLSITSGTGLYYQTFDGYGTLATKKPAKRKNGVLIANGEGRSVAFALFNLQERGKMLIDPGEDVYEGEVIGVHNRENDLVVNPLKGKKLTNMRASGNDENIVLTPAIHLSLEQALQFIEDDELVEVTPSHIRVRKRFLCESERKRRGRID